MVPSPSRLPLSSDVRQLKRTMIQGEEHSELRVALAFVEAINSRQPGHLAELMTDNHKFIDTDGNSVQGKVAMGEAWRRYYALFPDYALSIDQAIVREDLVILTGSSSGNLSDHGKKTLMRPNGSPAQAGDFQGRAIWTARIEGDLVSEWRVYPDTDSLRQDLLSGKI